MTNQPQRVRVPKRAVHGVLLLDKPQGISSNSALQIAKRLYRAQKAGHSGSLDPLATGLLPLCFGEATKVSGFLLDADKTYRFSAQLGVTTDSGDADGQVLATRPLPADLSPERVEAVLAQFRGPILQIPPMYSAVHHQGQRLYRLARQGVEVERPARPVTIHDLRLLTLAGATLECEVRCSKGTYVRVLAEDIGQALGCGAHITVLRRVGVAPYDASRMLTLPQLEALAAEGEAALDAQLLPVDSAIAAWPALTLSAELAHALRLGQALRIDSAPNTGCVRVYSANAGFIGIGEILDDGRVAPKRLIQSGERPVGAASE